ncbi:MAG: EAL domain-containing protein [Bradymonadaceae bacterium]
MDDSEPLDSASPAQSAGRDLTRSRTDPRFEQLSHLFERLGSDPEENIETLVAEAKSLLDGEFCLYHRVDDRTDEFKVVAARGLPPKHPDRSDAEGQICYELTMREDDGLAVVEDLQDSKWGERYPEFGAYLGVPVRLEGRTVGSLCIMTDRARSFTSADRRLFSALGTAVSLEEERRRADSRVERLNSILQSINDVAQAVVRERDRDRIWESTCDILTDNDRIGSALILTRETDDSLQIEASAPEARPADHFVERHAIGEELERVLDGRADHLSWNPLPASTSSNDGGATEPSHWFGVPIDYRGLIYGVLLIGSNFEAHDPDERTLLDGVANDLAFVTHTLVRETDEDHVAEQALRDWLTGLPNRTLFRSRLDHVISRSERRDRSFALLFIDLDGLKDVNDSLGHAAGDRLLVQFANRLESTFREEDTVARVGGDEFTVLLEDLEPGSTVDGYLERLEEKIDVPFEIEGERVHSSASIGVVRYQRLKERLDRDRLSDDEVMRAADQAMYRAKERARTEWSTVNGDDLEDRRQIQRANELRRAIDSGEIVPYFHPILTLADQQLRGVEALARWEHPEEGTLSAGDFIPLAERRGFLWTLSRRLFRTAFEHFERWESPDAPPLRVLLNISPASFDEGAFVDVFEEFELDPDRIVFEITEQALLRSPERIQRLADRGFRIAVDDFGTGYSSFKYLKELPIDVLKLDMSFVQGAPENETDRSIVEMVCGLGASLELAVVAEGVETDAQLDIVRDVGCKCAQGYLFDYPMAAERVEEELLTPE